MKAYPHGALYKLLRVLDLRLGTILRSVLVSSLEAWQRFVQSSTVVKPMLQQLSKTPSSEDNSLMRGSKSDSKEDILPIDEYWRQIYEPRPRDTEIFFDIYSQKSPLFQVQLVVNTSEGREQVYWVIIDGIILKDFI